MNFITEARVPFKYKLQKLHVPGEFIQVLLKKTKDRFDFHRICLQSEKPGADLCVNPYFSNKRVSSSL